MTNAWAQRLHVHNDVKDNEIMPNAKTRMSRHGAPPTPRTRTHEQHGQTHTNARGGGKPRIATNDKMVPWPIGASSSKKLKLRDKIKALFR